MATVLSVESQEPLPVAVVGPVAITGLMLPGGGVSIGVPLPVTNGTYSTGDVAGGLITLPGAVRNAGGRAVVNSVKLAGATVVSYELWLLAAPGTPIADNAPLTVDASQVLGVVPITAADYNQTGAVAVATVRGVGLQVQAANGTALYGYLRATTPTSPATGTLYLTVDVEWVD